MSSNVIVFSGPLNILPDTTFDFNNILLNIEIYFIY